MVILQIKRQNKWVPIRFIHSSYRSNFRHDNNNPTIHNSSRRKLRKLLFKRLSYNWISRRNHSHRNIWLSQKKWRGDSWFNLIDNIYDDLFFNKIFFEFYKHFFDEHSSQESISYNLKDDDLFEISEFISIINNSMPQNIMNNVLKVTKFGFATFVYLFNEDLTKILLIKRNKEKRDKYGADWGSIGGKIEPGELSIQACIREAKEESDLEIDSQKLNLALVKEIVNESIGEYAIHFRYSLILNENTPILLNNESEEYRWFSLDSLPDKMFESREEIIDILEATRKFFIFCSSS